MPYRSSSLSSPSSSSLTSSSNSHHHRRHHCHRVIFLTFVPPFWNLGILYNESCNLNTFKFIKTLKLLTIPFLHSLVFCYLPAKPFLKLTSSSIILNCNVSYLIVLHCFIVYCSKKYSLTLSDVVRSTHGVWFSIDISRILVHF